MANTVSVPMKWLPSAALGTSITPSSTAWAYSNWVQISASMSAKSALAALTIDTADATAAGFELEIGVGASGSETTISIVRGAYQSSIGQIYFQLPVLVDKIPSGVRVAARLRKAGASTTIWRVSIGYYENSTADNLSTGDPVSFPSGTDAPAVTPSGTSWASSSYVELSSNTGGNPIHVQGLSVNPAGTAAVPFEIDLATGASGSETVLTTIRGRYDSNVGMQIVPFNLPVYIPAGVRLSYRLRKGNTTVNTWTVGMYGVKEPNFAPNTPTLLTPSNAGTVNSITPQLTFNTTDPDGDDVSYEIEIDTVNTFDSQVASVNATVMAWGGGGGGRGYQSGWQNASGSGGGFAQSSVTVNNATGYTIVVGSGGTGTIASAAGNGGDSYFTTTGSTPTTSSQGALAKGGIGGVTNGSTAPATGHVGTVTYNGGSSGVPTTPGSGGAGGGAGSGGNGGNGANGILGGSAAGGTGGIGTFPGGAGANGAGNTPGVSGTAPGGGGSGSGDSFNAGGSGGAGRVIVTAPVGTIATATGGTYSTDGVNDYWTFTSSGTWTPTIAGPLIDAKSSSDAGFTDTTNGADTSPFASGDTIRYTVGQVASIAAGAVVATNFSSSVTSMPVTLPASNSGDLLLAWVEARNSGSYTPPSGWTQLGLQTAIAGQLTVFWKKASGLDGTSATWTSGASTTATWQVRRITGWHGTTAPEIVMTSGDNSNADPSSISPSWGNADTLYLAVAGHASLVSNAFTAGPSGYSDFLNSGQNTGGSSTSLASAYKETVASSEDPGAFTAGGSNRYWATATIAVRTQVAQTLTDHVTYYWRVRASDVGFTSNWSSIRSFTVSTAPQYTRSHTTDVFRRIQSTKTHTTSVFKRLRTNYTRQSAVSVPTNNNDLTYTLSDADVSTVSADDGTYVNQTGSGYLLFQFKYENTNSTNAITVTWNGKASVAPSSSTVYLQIWNYNSSTWETLQSNSSTAANTDFTLTGTKTTNLSNYYSSNIVTARVYQ